MIWIDIGFESRRSRPAIGVKYRLIDSTDSIKETFELRPIDFPESAGVYEGQLG